MLKKPRPMSKKLETQKNTWTNTSSMQEDRNCLDPIFKNARTSPKCLKQVHSPSKKAMLEKEESP
jgi:hypothetical protein